MQGFVKTNTFWKASSSATIFDILFSKHLPNLTEDQPENVLSRAGKIPAFRGKLENSRFPSKDNFDHLQYLLWCLFSNRMKNQVHRTPSENSIVLFYQRLIFYQLELVLPIRFVTHVSNYLPTKFFLFIISCILFVQATPPTPPTPPSLHTRDVTNVNIGLDVTELFWSNWNVVWEWSTRLRWNVMANLTIKH